MLLSYIELIQIGNSVCLGYANYKELIFFTTANRSGAGTALSSHGK